VNIVHVGCCICYIVFPVNYPVMSCRNGNFFVWFHYNIVVVYFHQNKKRRRSKKRKCHSKSMMSNETNEKLKRDTQDVSLRKNSKEKVRGKGVKVVWDDVNE
jgi:hypothetical protein